MNYREKITANSILVVGDGILVNLNLNRDSSFDSSLSDNFWGR